MGQQIFCETFEYEKKKTIRAARELCYSKHIISKLEAAKSSAEMSRIMKDARTGKLT